MEDSILHNCTDVSDPEELKLINPFEPPYCSVEDWVVILQIIILVIIVVGSIVGNAFVLLLVAKFRALRYRSIIVSLSVVVVDLLLSLFYITPAVVNTIARRWVFGGVIGCTAIGLIVFYLLGVRWLVMGVISIDRFCFVIFPFSYKRWSRPFLVVLTLIAWVVPLLIFGPSLVAVDYTFRPGFSHCTVDCGENRTICSPVVSALFGGQLLVGAVLPLILYAVLYIYGRWKNTNIKLGTQANEPKRRQSIIRIPAAWSAREKRALFTFLFVFIALFITNLPVFALSVLRPIQPYQYSQIPLWGHFIYVDLFYLLSVIDPVIIMRNRDFRKAAYKLFCYKRYRNKHRSSISSTRKELSEHESTLYE